MLLTWSIVQARCGRISIRFHVAPTRANVHDGILLQVNAMRRFNAGIALLLSLVCARLLLAPSFAVGEVCTAAPPLPGVVKVAILVHCDGPVGVLDRNPNFSPMCAPDNTPTSQVLVRQYLFGQNTWTRTMPPPHGLSGPCDH
jgi:hypothetical protein